MNAGYVNKDVDRVSLKYTWYSQLNQDYSEAVLPTLNIKKHPFQDAFKKKINFYLLNRIVNVNTLAIAKITATNV